MDADAFCRRLLQAYIRPGNRKRTRTAAWMGRMLGDQHGFVTGWLAPQFSCWLFPSRSFHLSLGRRPQEKRGAPGPLLTHGNFRSALHDYGVFHTLEHHSRFADAAQLCLLRHRKQEFSVMPTAGGRFCGSCLGRNLLIRGLIASDGPDLTWRVPWRDFLAAGETQCHLAEVFCR